MYQEDGNSAAELRRDVGQRDVESVTAEIERELKVEAEALLGSAKGMYELFSDCEPDVIPNLVAILSAGRNAQHLTHAVEKMNAYLLDLAKNMKREEVTQRVMEERESIEYGYEG